MQRVIGTPGSTSSRHTLSQPYARDRKGIPWRLRLCILSRNLRRRLLDSWCTWYGAYCSFRGHIRTLTAKDHPAVDYGPSLERLSDGTLQACKRTLARNLYTQKMRAIFPWADVQDHEIFLMGFHAGEMWHAQTGNSLDEVGDISTPWLTPADGIQICKQIDQRLS